MANVSRKAPLTAELLRLTKQQSKALEDAVYLGWGPGALEAYQERGERVSLLRQQLNAAAAEDDNVLQNNLAVVREVEPEPDLGEHS
jgi:hypothetical protein